MTIDVSTFRPQNDVEHALIQAQEGQLTIPTLMTTLVASQVFVLIDKDPGPDGIWDNSATPLVLHNSAGIPVLAIFTSPDRSTDWTKHQPTFCFGLLTNFGWLLKGIAPGVGIVINPGSPVGMEIPPHGVQQLQAETALLGRA